MTTNTPDVGNCTWLHLLICQQPAQLLPHWVNSFAHCSGFIRHCHLNPYEILKVTAQIQIGQSCRDCHEEKELSWDVSQQSALLCLLNPVPHFHKAITHTESSICNLPKPQILGGVAFQKWQVLINTMTCREECVRVCMTARKQAVRRVYSKD